MDRRVFNRSIVELNETNVDFQAAMTLLSNQSIDLSVLCLIS